MVTCLRLVSFTATRAGVTQASHPSTLEQGEGGLGGEVAWLRPEQLQRRLMDVDYVARFLSNRRLLNGVVAYQELFCVVTLPASSSNHGEDDGNDSNIKIQRV